MWTLIVLVLHINSADDIISTIKIPVKSEFDCEKQRSTLTYILKSDELKVSSLCQQVSQ